MVSERVANTISSKGFGYGYLAAVILLFVGGGIAIGMGDGRRFGLTPTYGLQVGIAVTSLWFIVFLYFTAHYMKSRPGPPLPRGENYLLFSFKKGRWWWCVYTRCVYLSVCVCVCVCECA